MNFAAFHAFDDNTLLIARCCHRVLTVRQTSEAPFFIKTQEKHEAYFRFGKCQTSVFRKGKAQSAHRLRLGCRNFSWVVSITAVAGVVSFIEKRNNDNTELFATDFGGCPDTLENLYYLSGIGDNYVLQESNINEIIAADYLYLDSQTGKKIVFEQYVKSQYNQHFDNEHNNDLEYINFDGQEAYYKGSDEYSVFIWDNGDYIFAISGNLTKTEIAELAKTLKIKNN